MRYVGTRLEYRRGGRQEGRKGGRQEGRKEDREEGKIKGWKDAFFLPPMCLAREGEIDKQMNGLSVSVLA